jgi:hypothetical protein
MLRERRTPAVRQGGRRELLVAGWILLAATPVAILGGCREGPRELESVASKRGPPAARHGFTLEAASLASTRDGRRELLLAVDSFLLVNRVGLRGLLVYQNLKELHATHVELDLFEDEPRPEGLSFQSALSEALASLGSLAGTAIRTPGGPDTGDRDLLTLVVFRDLGIRVHLPGERRVSILAGRARLSLDTELLVFDSGASFLASDGSRLGAERAALSERGEIQLPAGYVLDGRPYAGGAVFVITQLGGFRREASAPPELEWIDVVEESEALLLARLLRGAPPYTRALLSAWGRTAPPLAAATQPPIPPRTSARAR